VCRIATVRMRFSLSCEPAGSRQALDQTELCAHSTAHDRFQEWVEAGVFLKLWQAGVERFDDLRGIDWEWLAMDGAMTKAPLGGEKNWTQSY
jgi:putative transposase